MCQSSVSFCTSDEGDTSDSSISDKEGIEFAQGSWSCDIRDSTVSPEYICPPPPTPTFVPPRSFELAKRRSMKGLATGRSYLQRRRMLVKTLLPQFYFRIPPVRVNLKCTWWNVFRVGEQRWTCQPLIQAAIYAISWILGTKVWRDRKVSSGRLIIGRDLQKKVWTVSGNKSKIVSSGRIVPQHLHPIDCSIKLVMKVLKFFFAT